MKVMSLSNILHKVKTKVVLPTAFALASTLGMSQEADTSFAPLEHQYLKVTDFQPLEGVSTSVRALEMEDTVPETNYTGLSDANGIVQDTVPVCIDSTVGLADLYKDAVRVCPIPGNEINIQLPQDLAGQHQLNLYDMSGRQVLSEQFNGVQEHISLENLARGAYVFNLTRDGEQVFSGKTVKVDVPVRGMQSYQPKSLAKNGQQKDLGDCEATYRIVYDAPDGWVNDSLDVTVSNTEDNLYEILVQPWDTAYANGNIITFDNTGNNASFVNLTLNSQNMEQILIPISNNPTLLESGNGSAYQNLPVAVDTTGETASTNAIYQVSWPFAPRPNLDSASTNIDFLGWQAGETTLEFEPGNNTNKFITLQRLLPEDEHPVYAKKYIEGYIGILRDGSPGSVNVPADGAIVVIQYNDDNPDPTIPVFDTLQVQPTGYWVSNVAYPDGAELFIGGGYPGGVHNGQELGSYKGIDYIVEGSNLLDIVAGDTNKVYKMNLVQKSAWSGQTEENVDMTMAQFKEMYGRPNQQLGRFGVYTYHINENGFEQGQLNSLHQVIDNYSSWMPFEILESLTTLENESPYNLETVTAASHGVNIIEGTDQLISAQQAPSIPFVQDEETTYVSSIIGVTGISQNFEKEKYMRALGMSPVTSRPSVANADPTSANALDIAIMTQKYYIDKAMFNSEESISVPFDYQNQTQNVSPNYLSDDTNITPQ